MNPHLANIIRNAGGRLDKSKVLVDVSEDEAFEFEKFLISEIGRETNGGPLVNQSDGGEGPTGRKASPQELARLSARMLGNKPWNAGKRGCFSEEARAKMRAAKLGREHSAETKEKLSASRRGRTLSIETRLKISRAKTGKKLDEEGRARLRDSNRSRDPAVRARISAATRSAMSDPVRRAKCAWNRLDLTDEQRLERKKRRARENQRVYRERKKRSSK